MRYWLLCLPRNDMEHCIKIGIFGMNRKYLLAHVQAGDKVACYITKEYKIIAFGEAKSSHYTGEKKIFLSDGLFPDRIDIEAKLLGSSAELDFMSVIDQMSFIKKLAYWSAYMRNPVIELSKSDYKLLLESTPTPV